MGGQGRASKWDLVLFLPGKIRVPHLYQQQCLLPNGVINGVAGLFASVPGNCLTSSRVNSGSLRERAAASLQRLLQNSLKQKNQRIKSLTLNS